MADDIGGMGEDPRDVARRRLNVGRRAREAEAARRAAGQASGPSMTPPTQAMVPYRENLPASSGGRGVPPGAADMLRGAMQSPMARAAGTGRAGAGRAVVEGAMRVVDQLTRGGRSPVTRIPADALGNEAPEPMGAVAGTEMQGPPIPNPKAPALPSEKPPPLPRQGGGAPAPRPRQAARPAPRESMTADDLNEIVLRLTRGEKPVTETEKRLADRMGIAYRKGGMVKGKGMHMMPDGSMMKNKDHAAMKKGGKAKMYREGGKVRQGIQSPKAQEARAEMAEDVMKRSMPAEPRRRMRDMMSPEERRGYDAPLTPQELERMRESGFKKGGMIKPKTAMKKGGAVKAPAKKMAHGGKVAAPKKMMKGGMTSKPKKMMGGGRAMYAKGGMAKGRK